jgi:hypothetical protein
MSVNISSRQLGYAKVAIVIVLAAVTGGSHLFYNVMSMRAKDDFHRTFADCYVNLYGMADAVKSGGDQGNEKFNGYWERTKTNYTVHYRHFSWSMTITRTKSAVKS